MKYNKIEKRTQTTGLNVRDVIPRSTNKDYLYTSIDVKLSYKQEREDIKEAWGRNIKLIVRKFFKWNQFQQELLQD